GAAPAAVGCRPPRRGPRRPRLGPQPAGQLRVVPAACGDRAGLPRVRWPAGRPRDDPRRLGDRVGAQPGGRRRAAAGGLGVAAVAAPRLARLGRGRGARSAASPRAVAGAGRSVALRRPAQRASAGAPPFRPDLRQVIVVSSNPPEGPDRPHGSSEPSGEQRPTDPYGTSQPGQGRYGQGDAGHGQYGQGQPSPGQYPQYGQPQYGQQGQYYPSAPGYYGGPPVNDRDNSYGVVALVTGIIALLMCQPLGVVPFIFWRKALQAQAARTPIIRTLWTVVL